MAQDLASIDTISNSSKTSKSSTSRGKDKDKDSFIDFSNEDVLWCLKKRDLHEEPSITSNSFEWRANTSKANILDLLPNRYLKSKWKSKNCTGLVRTADEYDTKMEGMYISKIANFTKSSENRVIAFGLYGNSSKYCTGAIRNAELSLIYFPGWRCRFYVTDDVPEDVVMKLRGLGAELVQVKERSMFSRFLVAADDSIDRFIIRDADSRLNARDRLAVQDWIESNMPLHSVRDHTNHCNGINGGMWGGVYLTLDIGILLHTHF